MLCLICGGCMHAVEPLAGHVSRPAVTPLLVLLDRPDAAAPGGALRLARLGRLSRLQLRQRAGDRPGRLGAHTQRRLLRPRAGHQAAHPQERGHARAADQRRVRHSAAASSRLKVDTVLARNVLDVACCSVTTYDCQLGVVFSQATLITIASRCQCRCTFCT